MTPLRKSDAMAGAVALLLGLSFLVPAIGLGIASPTSDGVPGAGFFPALTSGLLVLLGVILLVRGLRDPGAWFPTFSAEQRANVRLMLATIGGVLGLLVIWYGLGHTLELGAGFDRHSPVLPRHEPRLRPDLAVYLHLHPGAHQPHPSHFRRGAQGPVRGLTRTAQSVTEAA